MDVRRNEASLQQELRGRPVRALAVNKGDKLGRGAQALQSIIDDAPTEDLDKWVLPTAAPNKITINAAWARLTT
jgi:hypothetical protein